MKRKLLARGNQHRGISLVVGLVMLIVLTLLVVSAVRMSNSSLRIVGNQQARAEASAAAQQAIEKVIGSAANFYTPAAQSFDIDINNDGIADYAVQTAAPACLQMVAADGYSYEFSQSAPQDTYWDVTAVATDKRGSGVTVTVHQGVKVRMDSTATCT
ncbi:PilX N-terminal domain-containing pilus assembly protein [Cupriavidus sp. WKF15]|uniref:pilus assembly PilX family protein n=1 Tax=Cupriavidus sp. WKF15 TaxID=3032282 RepID=UPI0023E2590E|nr:PilX N-terminal domain-containing pilus assembly protein [Cupriavidus sp. WKF15]WER46412.1 PilX N-terminal domain-containing pilus assembly protein [Cupriavidus sp. WKF15]